MTLPPGLGSPGIFFRKGSERYLWVYGLPTAIVGEAMVVSGCLPRDWPSSVVPVPAPRSGYHHGRRHAMTPDSGAAPNPLESTLELLARVREGDRDALERLI